MQKLNLQKKRTQDRVNGQPKNLISQFCKPLDFLQYDQPQENTIILNLQKKVNSMICQYGINNERASKIIVNYVQKLKDKAEQLLKTNPKQAHAYFAKALSFLTPTDKINHIKMLIIKITICNKFFHQIHPSPQSQLLIQYAYSQLANSDHKLAFKKNFDLHEQTVYFLLGYLRYKKGLLEQAVSLLKQAEQTIQNKLQIVYKSKKNDQSDEDKNLLNYQKDITKLFIKVKATSAKSFMKLDRREQSLQMLKDTMNELSKDEDRFKFELYYLQKKAERVEAYFSVKSLLKEVPLMKYKSYIEQEMSKIIEDSKMKNQQLFRFSFRQRLS